MLNKKYGQIGESDVEAQKALARGLKQEIENIIPDVKGINLKESDLIKTSDVLNRRLIQSMNNNPIGIAGLSPTPSNLLTMLLDKNDYLKSLAALGIYNTSNFLKPVTGLLGNDTSRSIMYKTLPILPATSGGE
jgi:hypothetical protein